jgi:hypothetical protein
MANPSRAEALLHKCHDCQGEYFDGKDDCQNPKCPLYSWMPYAEMTPDLTWQTYNPKMKGRVLKEDSKRDLTDEQRAQLSERMTKAREARSEK